MVKGKLEREINKIISQNLTNANTQYQLTKRLQVNDHDVMIKMDIQFHLGRDKPFAELISTINQSVIPLGYSCIRTSRYRQPAAGNTFSGLMCELWIMRLDEEETWEPNKMEQREIRDGIIALIDELDESLFKKKLEYVQEYKRINYSFMFKTASAPIVGSVLCGLFTSSLFPEWCTPGAIIILLTGLLCTEGRMINEWVSTSSLLAKVKLIDETNKIV